MEVIEIKVELVIKVLPVESTLEKSRTFESQTERDGE